MPMWSSLNLEHVTDGRKVSEIISRGQQVYLNDLDIPVYLSWVWLKRDRFLLNWHKHLQNLLRGLTLNKQSLY